MANDEEAERFWQVMAIHSCVEDPGPGFGYTVGLATRGLPELHLWDRPTHGDDPAADFALSGRDLCSILNELAVDWLEGRLEVGEHRDIAMDGGLSSARITVGDAVPAEQLDAWHAMPSRVVPLRWRLERPARGPAVPVADDQRHGYETDLDEVVGLCREPVAVVGAYLRGERLTFDVDERYGPLTTLVGAHARAMAGTDRLSLLIDNALCAEAAISPRALTGHMATLSRVSGRDGQVHEVQALAQRATSRLQQRRIWRDMVGQMAHDAGQPFSRYERNVADLVGTLFCSALIGIALDDVLPEDMRLASQGPWRSAISELGGDPGPSWRCSKVAERRVREVFSELTPQGCMGVERALEGPLFDVVDPHDVSRAVGAALTSAMSPPPVHDLVPAGCRLVAAFPMIRQDLTIVARLITAVVDGAVSLDPHQLRELERLLALPLAGIEESRAA